MFEIRRETVPKDVAKKLKILTACRAGPCKIFPFIRGEASVTW